MTIRFTITDGNESMHVYDFNGDELDSSPVENPTPPSIQKDRQGVPVKPDLRRACQEHLDGQYQPSAYTQQFLAEITLGDVEEGAPE